MEFTDDFAGKQKEVDPAAEFLAREQSVLGDLESEIIPNAKPATADVPFNNTEKNELVAPAAGLESSTGSFEISGESTNDVLLGISEAPSRVEPEKIRKWREEQERRLREKDLEEERKKEELREQAKQELEDWLRQTEETIAKTKAAARNAEKQATALENGNVMEPGTEWERIAKLCDFNPKVNKTGKDVSRMRSIYLHLKQNPILNATN